MKKLLVICGLLMLMASECITYPPPPYPDPDKITYGDFDVKYEWSCYQNDYVVVIYYYHSSNEWRMIEERAPGICLH